MFIVFCLMSVSLHAFVYHPFDELTAVNDTATQMYVGCSAQAAYQSLKQCYDLRISCIDSLQKKTGIPKIIHQIWLGSSVPTQFDAFRESCQRMHPEWRYMLWTHDNLHMIQMKNRALLRASRNPGEMSDILRYEILYQYGGVYLDCDISCIGVLDELNELFDFYIGLQPLDTGFVQLGIGVIGAAPQHPIIAAARDGIVRTWSDPALAHMATARTGPLYFTRIFLEQWQSCDDALVLPSFYFYPLGSQSVDIHAQSWSTAGAYTIHHWAKSWLLPQFRRAQFQEIKNY